MLARHLLSEYGAPNLAAALEAAREETAFISEMCEEVRPGVIFAVSRSVNAAGEIEESFRKIDQPRARRWSPRRSGASRMMARDFWRSSG